MSPRTLLIALFTCILLAMVVCTGWASAHQPVMQWGGLTGSADRYWTIATLMDAYFGFLTFYIWVFFKEPRWALRVLWFVAIMLLGNMAMAAYVLIQLAKLRPHERVATILSSRNHGQIS